MGPDIAKHEVAIAALVRGGKVLLGHRHPHRRWYPDCWDLIGGHVERGEAAEETIRRECREELAIAIRNPLSVGIVLEDHKVIPHAFDITDWDGDAMNNAPLEHDAIDWFTREELTALPLADLSYATWIAFASESAEREDG